MLIQAQTHIYLVDSDAISRLLFKRQLERHHPTVVLHAFADADAFLEKLWTDRKQVNLLLIDINLSYFSGWELLRRLKAYELDAEIVLTSSFVGPDELVKALQFPEITGIIEKPVLLRKLKMLCKTPIIGTVL
jgi:CheY-like chemotaxis protein